MVSRCSRKSAGRGPGVEDEGGGAEETCTVDDGEEEGDEDEDEDEDEEGGLDEAPGVDEGEGGGTDPPPEDWAEDMTENQGKKEEESGEKKVGDDGESRAQGSAKPRLDRWQNEDGKEKERGLSEVPGKGTVGGQSSYVRWENQKYGAEWQNRVEWPITDREGTLPGERTRNWLTVGVLAFVECHQRTNVAVVVDKKERAKPCYRTLPHVPRLYNSNTTPSRPIHTPHPLIFFVSLYDTTVDYESLLGSLVSSSSIHLSICMTWMPRGEPDVGMLVGLRQPPSAAG